MRVGGKRVVGRSVSGARGERRTGEKKGENNKAPVGAYILGKNCRGRKRMRGNRRGEGQDDGNLPADILCVSCERAGLPTVTYTVRSQPRFSRFRSTLRALSATPFICLLGFSLGPLITAGNHEVGAKGGGERTGRKKKKREKPTAISLANFLSKDDINNPSQPSRPSVVVRQFGDDVDDDDGVE